MCIVVPCPVTVHERNDLEYFLAQCSILQNTGSVKREDGNFCFK